MNQTRKINIYRTRIVAPSRIIKDAYGAHRLFWRAFPGHDPGSVQPFTFAEQEGGQRGEKVFLMHSRIRPDFSEVLGISAETREIHLELKEGEFLYFRLRAAPTKSESVEERPPEGQAWRRGKRVGIKSARGVEEWLDKQGERCGFKIKQMVFDVTENDITLHSASSGKEHDFKCASAIFDGGLVVTDPGKFESALFNGVGRGRSYGFGMLLVAK